MQGENKVPFSEPGEPVELSPVDQLHNLAAALRSGRQVDTDGVYVVVSRKACEEAAAYIEQTIGEVI